MYNPGDKVIYRNGMYEVIGRSPYNYSTGQNDYSIQGSFKGSIIHYVVEDDLIPYYYDSFDPEAGAVGFTPIVPKASNPCECGAHATFLPSSHSSWCPMFKQNQ